MELKIVGTRNQFSDAGLDVVEGVGERCQLLHRVLLPLVRRRPIQHRQYRRHRRRLFGCGLTGAKNGDEVVDVQCLVVREAGVGLPGQA